MGLAYQRVLAKYAWAKKHVDDFGTAADAFRLGNPHTVGKMLDARTGQIVYCVKAVPVIPDRLPFMLGDAIHNLRCTLDHLAYALVSATGVTPHKHTSFPICDTPEAFPGLSRSKVPGLGEMCYEILKQIQPYKGGWGNNLWRLHQLDIVDKHRLLLTVATIPVGRCMTPSEEANRHPGQPNFVGLVDQWFDQMMGVASNPEMVPIEAGYELARFPATEEYENMAFAFDIAINEADFAEGMPVWLTLQGFSGDILRVVQKFDGYL